VIAAGLPRDFPAPICAVVHVSPDSPGVLASILSGAGVLPATTALSGERLEPGRIYVAPPDHHLVVEPGVLQLTKGPKENRFRPAIDPLFRSAAQVYGPDAIGVLLTGNLDDGVAGLWTIKQLGGVAIVQDPADAMFPSMPAAALHHVNVDHVAVLAEISSLLTQVVLAPVQARERVAVPAQVDVEVSIAKEGNPVDAGIERIAEPSSFTCPECHGVLLQVKDTSPLRFRCHVGHAFSAQTLVAAISQGMEEALWTAARTLEEGGLLLQQLADHLLRHEDRTGAENLAAQAVKVRQQSNAVRQFAMGHEELSTPTL
jgi:two-component system chemotaxis response regulator CheB